VSWGARVAAGVLALLAATAAAQPPKVLRYAFDAAETGFDPAQVNDQYSRIVTAHVFDALYRFDYLAHPVKVVTNTAAAMPEVSDDFKTWTVRIRPGIHFADDPAFGGRRRELVAADYVFAWKRYFDPANKSPVYSTYDEQGVLGMNALREEALRRKAPFDYDREVEGIRALDRYTIQFRLDKPRPRFIYTLADSSLYSAVAREVVEHYKGDIAEHPVGTGPFRLKSWRRSSQIVLERNPGFRDEFYDADPDPADAEGQALLQRYRGRRLPMIDQVEIAIIEEAQPRWLSFVNGEFDLAWPLPFEFADHAVPNGKLAPHLAKRGLALHQVLATDRTFAYYNMDDPVVGGYGADKVALRRAINLAIDVQREILLIRKRQAMPAQSVVAPGTYGYDPLYKSENSDYSVARAKALLDMFGYIDRDGDGWRDLPDGRPLVIEYASYPDSYGRQYDEAWKAALDPIGIRLKVRAAQFPEHIKAARSGQLMVWQLGYSAASPDVQDGLQLLYGPASGGQNLARFRLARFDKLYERIQVLPDGPERLALLDEALKLVAAYAPHKYRVHRILADLTHPWLLGYRRPPFGYRFWQYVDIDDSRRPPR
jgi:ABC-type transport system substrate-binding protein